MSTDAKTEVLALEDRRYQAMLDADLEVLDSLCADDLVYTHSNATRDSKASYLAKVADGVFVYQSIEHPVDAVVARDDCVVVAGQMRAQVINSGERKSLDNAALAVWVRDPGGSWRFVAYQPTPNPASA